jgi:hypothetical protein
VPAAGRSVFFGGGKATRGAWTVIRTLQIARLTEQGGQHGLESQLRELRAAAEKRNLGAVVIEYTDMVTGENDSRPRLDLLGRNLAT